MGFKMALSPNRVGRDELQPAKAVLAHTVMPTRKQRPAVGYEELARLTDCGHVLPGLDALSYPRIRPQNEVTNETSNVAAYVGLGAGSNDKQDGG